MGEAIPDLNIPQSAKDYEPELQSLRNRLEHLERVTLTEAQVRSIARGAIKVQSGHNCRVSGGNGEWTIDFQMPPATVVVTGVCVGTGYQVSGTIQWG